MLNGKTLNKNIPVPLYYQLETILQEEIDNGTYPVGSQIPTEKELSQMFNISRTTVRQAIVDMVQKEKLYRTKSKGTFVAHPKTSQEFMRSIMSYDDDVRAAGRKPSTEVLNLSVVELDAVIAAKMGLEEGTKAIYLYRKRLVDNDPFVRVETFLPYESCKFLLKHDFTKESLYEVLSGREKTHVVKIVRICEVKTATSEDVKLLGLKRGKPIHFFTSMGYNAEGQLVEYSLASYRGDESKFRVVISRE